MLSVIVIAKQRKRVEKGEPFPYFDVMDFVPNWCGTKPQTGTKAPATFGAWVAGFQDFALAAAANGMWSFVASYTHFRQCTRIACESKLEGKTWHLVVAYDELARKAWAERAARGKTLHAHTDLSMFPQIWCFR